MLPCELKSVGDNIQMLAELLDAPPMAETVKRGRGRPDKGRNDVSVRIDAQIASWARYVARDRKESIAEYLSKILEPIVRRDMGKASAKLLKPGDKPEGER
jgi:hypothetical protein